MQQEILGSCATGVAPSVLSNPYKTYAFCFSFEQTVRSSKKALST